MLVTLKNHTLLPAKPTNLRGPRSVKNQKAIKNAYKAIEDFLATADMTDWKKFDTFCKDANSIAIKSKLDQITAFQSNPQIAGFFLDQWADYGIDFSGLNDENRKSKGFTDFAKEISTPSRILVSELEHVVTPQSEVSFQLTLLNNSRLENVGIEISLLDEKGKVVKIYYAVQFGFAPPKIALIMNRPKALHFSYKRYLANQLRERFDLLGTPLVLLPRPRGESSENEEK